MKMTWVNHSGHLVTHGGVALLTDPWIEGAVFDDGLELLLPSVLRPEDFDLATHLWFSHEHPDHFFPSNLVQVPEPVRTGLKVLYQDADFGQVQGWCEGKGFPHGC